jgi:parallel beta-helix repeat protein
MKLVFSLSLIFFFLSLPTFALGATYYVATNGSDSNPGTITQTFRTINHGVSVLQPGDTLIMRVGTYNEWVDSSIDSLNPIPGGTSENTRTIIKGYPGETVIITPPAGSPNVFLFSGSNRRFITLENLTLDAPNITGDCIAFTWEVARGQNVPSFLRIKDSTIRNCFRDAIFGNGNSHEFINLKIHNNGTDVGNDHGYYLGDGMSNILIERNEIFGNTGFAIRWDIRGETSNVTIRHNIMRDNRCGGMEIGGVFGTNNLIHNNLIYNNGPCPIPPAPSLDNDFAAFWHIGGITIWGGDGYQIYNNTLYNNPAKGIHLCSGMNARVMNNMLFQNGTNPISTTAQGSPCPGNASGYVISHNLTGDPLLVNAASANFHLQSGSPAINAGVNLSPTVTTDFDGVLRPQGCCYDIGAYEYRGTPQPTPPAPTPTPKPLPPPVPTPEPSPAPSPLLSLPEKESSTSIIAIIAILALFLISTIVFFIIRKR